MKARYKISILFLFHDLLKFEGKSSSSYIHSIIIDSSYGTLLVGYFILVAIHDVLRPRLSRGRSSLGSRGSNHLDNYDKRWLEERGVCCRIQNWSTWLEWLKESADVSTEGEVVSEEDLLAVRRLWQGGGGRFSYKVRHCSVEQDEECVLLKWPFDTVNAYNII